MNLVGRMRFKSPELSLIDMDAVNSIFDEFKHDFFPGEEIFATLDTGEQYEGVIREKAKFPMIKAADGSVQRAAFSRYFVRLNSTNSEEALLDDTHIRRDRKVFTKQNLRAFLKNSLQREAWTGAPWLVKEHLATQYRLPMEIPAHLLQEARLLQNKVLFIPRPANYPPHPLSNTIQQQMLQMRPAKGRRSKNLTPHDFAQDGDVQIQIPNKVSRIASNQSCGNGSKVVLEWSTPIFGASTLIAHRFQATSPSDHEIPHRGSGHRSKT